MWFSIVLLSCLWIAVATWRAGPGFALGTATLLSFLMPMWIVWEIGPLPINLRIGIVGAALTVYICHPRSTWNLRPHWVDALLISLLLIHVLSDIWNQGWSWPLPVRAYGEWGLPYLAGRLALQQATDLRRLLPWGMAVSTLLGAWSITEAVSGENPVHLLVPERPDDFTTKGFRRWGITRAEGPCIHPIHFGMLQLLLLPWAVSWAGSAAGLFSGDPGSTRRGPHPYPPPPARGALAALRRGLPAALITLLPVLGIFGTATRGPLLAVFLAFGGFIFLRVPWSRIPFGVLAALVVLIVALKPGAVLDLLHRWGNERPEKGPQVILSGEKVAYSGTMNRILLWKVYGVAARRAGLLGYGTERITGFPIRVPMGPVDPSVTRHVRFIDNVYLLLLLRFGYLGATCFALLGLSAILAAWRQAVWRHAAAGEGLLRGWGQIQAGTLFAAMLAIATVFMPHDYGFALLWNFGLAAGLLAGTRPAAPGPIPIVRPGRARG